MQLKFDNLNFWHSNAQFGTKKFQWNLVKWMAKITLFLLMQMKFENIISSTLNQIWY